MASAGTKASPSGSKDVRVDVTNAVNEYFNALDDRDWETALDFFEDTYDSDYTSIGAPVMKGLSRDVNKQAWSGMLAGFDSTHHQVGNHVVRLLGLEGQVAQVRLKGTATHMLTLEDELHEWVTAGTYEMKLRLDASEKWRLFSIVYKQVGQRASVPSCIPCI
jgi:hypothetical protein